MLGAARIAAGETVLELGAGTGRLTAGAVERVGPDGDVVALESAAERLEEVVRAVSAPNVAYLIGDAAVLPLPDASVDVALSRSSLPDPADLREASRELFRVLRPGGRVSLLEPLDRQADAAADTRVTEEPSPRLDAVEPANALRSAGFAAVAGLAEPGEPWRTVTARKP